MPECDYCRKDKPNLIKLKEHKDWVDGKYCMDCLQGEMRVMKVEDAKIDYEDGVKGFLVTLVLENEFDKKFRRLFLSVRGQDERTALRNLQKDIAQAAGNKENKTFYGINRVWLESMIDLEKMVGIMSNSPNIVIPIFLDEIIMVPPNDYTNERIEFGMLKDISALKEDYEPKEPLLELWEQGDPDEEFNED